MTTRMYYKTKWPEAGVYCPLGKVICHPEITVWATDCETIPYREVNKYAKTLRNMTYEQAARDIAEHFALRYKGQVRVRVGEQDFWAESEA